MSTKLVIISYIQVEDGTFHAYLSDFGIAHVRLIYSKVRLGTRVQNTFGRV